MKKIIARTILTLFPSALGVAVFAADWKAALVSICAASLLYGVVWVFMWALENK